MYCLPRSTENQQILILRSLCVLVRHFQLIWSIIPFKSVSYFSKPRNEFENRSSIPRVLNSNIPFPFLRCRKTLEHKFKGTNRVGIVILWIPSQPGYYLKCFKTKDLSVKCVKYTFWQCDQTNSGSWRQLSLSTSLICFNDLLLRYALTLLTYILRGIDVKILNPTEESTFLWYQSPLSHKINPFCLSTPCSCTKKGQIVTSSGNLQ